MNQEVNNDGVTVDTQKSMKKKGLRKGYALSAIVLLLVVIGIYQIVFNNPKNIFLQSINNEYKKLDELLSDSMESMAGISKNTSVVSNAALDFDVQVQEGMLDENTAVLLDEINKLSILVDAAYDTKAKQFSYGIEAKHENSSLLNVAFYGKNQNIYVELKDLFDKYIAIPVEGYDALFESGEGSIEDARYIVTALKDSVLQNLNKKDFSISKVDITLGSETIKAKKITYTLTEEVALTLITDVLNDLKDDKKFIESYVNITGEETNDVKDMLESAIEELKENETADLDTTTKIEFSVYTKGLLNEALQYEINIDSEEEVAITYSNYKDITRIAFKENNNSILSIVNEKSKDSNYITTVVVDSVKLVINSKKENNTWTHTYKATVSGSDVEIRGEFVTTTKEVTKDKEYAGLVSFNFGMGMKNEEDLITLKAIINSSNKVVEQITLPNVDHSIAVEELSEEDINTIMTNLMNNEALMSFVNRIVEVTETGSSDDDNYSYDFDDSSIIQEDYVW